MFFAVGMKCKDAPVISDSVMIKLIEWWNLKWGKLTVLLVTVKTCKLYEGGEQIEFNKAPVYKGESTNKEGKGLKKIK